MYNFASPFSTIPSLTPWILSNRLLLAIYITVRDQLWSTCMIWFFLSIYITTLYIIICSSYSRRKLITLEVFKQYLKLILNTRTEDVWVSLTYFHFTIYFIIYCISLQIFTMIFLYPQRYIELIIPKGTSDDKADLDNQKKGRQLIYWIKHCLECSTVRGHLHLNP